MYDRRRLEEGFDLAELARRLANVVRVSVVVQVDHDAYRLRARYDIDDEGAPILTAWIPWTVVRAGDDCEWWSPENGEQVVLLSPSGELTQALALPALYSDDHPAPSADPDKRITKHTLQLSADKAAAATSIQDEYAARAATTENQLQLLANQANALAVNIGSVLLPTVIAAVGGIGDLASKGEALAKEFPAATRVVIGLIGGLVGLLVISKVGAYGATFLAEGWAVGRIAMNRAAGGAA